MKECQKVSLRVLNYHEQFDLLNCKPVRHQEHVERSCHRTHLHVRGRRPYSAGQIFVVCLACSLVK